MAFILMFQDSIHASGNREEEYSSQKGMKSTHSIPFDGFWQLLHISEHISFTRT